MSCQPEQVTGYVDGALEASERAQIESHLAECATCRKQADEERALRSRLLGLLHPAVPTGLETRVRSRLAKRRRVRLVRLLLPLTAAAAVLLMMARTSSRFVAWELARDHDHCYGYEALGYQIESEDAETVMRWFENQGTRMPAVPSSAGDLELMGARYCPLPDLSYSAHLFYGRGDKHPLSLFVLGRRLSPEDVQVEARGHVVRIVRIGETTVGLVGDRQEDVDNFVRTFRTSRAGSVLPLY
jgi:hypothetical protein